MVRRFLLGSMVAGAIALAMNTSMGQSSCGIDRPLQGSPDVLILDGNCQDPMTRRNCSIRNLPGNSGKLHINTGRDCSKAMHATANWTDEAGAHYSSSADEVTGVSTLQTLAAPSATQSHSEFNDGTMESY